MRAIALALLLGATAALAQTEEHEEADRIYQERLGKEAAEAKKPGSDRAAFVAAADKLIRDSKDYASKSTAHWQVRTDDPGVDVAAAGDLLEAFRNAFEEFWKGRLETSPSAEIGRVYVFTSFHDYNKVLTGSSLHGDFRPAGHYNLYTDVVALYLGSVPKGGLTDVLVHEGAHLLITREILRGRPAPPWLAEGLAVYFESTARTANGAVEIGQVKSTRAKERMRDFKKLLDAKPSWSAGALIDAEDAKAFYGDAAPGNYAASWLVVHALLHAESGRHAEAFAKFLSGASRGEHADAERLYEVTGLDDARLTALVAAHARSLEVR